MSGASPGFGAGATLGLAVGLALGVFVGLSLRHSPLAARVPALGRGDLGGVGGADGVGGLGASNPPRGGDDDAWARVQAAPRDPEAWGALGDAAAALDDVVAAEHAYTVALSLGARDPTLLGRLGFLLYQRGEEARALALLREAKRGGADLPMLDFTLERLAGVDPAPGAAGPRASDKPRPRADDTLGTRDARDAGAPGQAAAPPALPAPNADAGDADAAVRAPAATCAIPLEGQATGTRRLRVQVGSATLSLVFDTGASITSLTPEALARTGVAADHSRPIRAHTAGGVVRMPTAQLPALTVAGRTVGPLTIAVCEGCASLGTDGLFGLDAQAALGLELDVRRGEARVLDCR
jgi:hypothetical protein